MILKLDGYVSEVGDLNIGLSGPTPVKGFVLETPKHDITITGLSKAQCQKLALHIGKFVRIAVAVQQPVSEDEKHV